MTDWSDALRQAIYDVLVADASLRTELGASVTDPRIYTDVPDKKTFPFIVLGDEVEDRWATHDKSGGEVSFPYEIWTREPSWQKNNLIRGHVLRLQGDVDLTVAGFDTVGGYFEGSEKFKDPTEGTKQQVLQIRFNMLES